MLASFEEEWRERAKKMIYLLKADKQFSRSRSLPAIFFPAKLRQSRKEFYTVGFFLWGSLISCLAQKVEEFSREDVSCLTSCARMRVHDAGLISRSSE
ncbi:hypothetical protein BaRGS_00029058 [Batillaria attramentaria]|uniref:Uncharacterized protein n=1 Tax=Batillaria attramentaria TaxID=370345 RepID=A0ABD0JXE2_9CAEN